MIKKLLKINIVLLVNLFAFLIVGHILDVIFLQEDTFKLTFVMLSLIPLLFFIIYNFRKNLKNGKH